MRPDIIRNLGVALGIARSRLTKIGDGDIINEMVELWLMRVDQVPEKSKDKKLMKCTWEDLVEGMQHPTVNLATDQIESEKL